MEPAEPLLKRGLPQWQQSPIPNLSLSAGGLIALADLSTVAQRTALTGGSTWQDSLVLAPGLHYQQAADALGQAAGIATAVEEGDASRTAIAINNAATVHYLQKIARPGELVTLDVGSLAPRIRSWAYRSRKRRGRRAGSGGRGVWDGGGDADVDLGWLSHLLYLMSPVLTIAALVFSVLLRDWWCLAFILSLMLSRLLNIYVIKARTKTGPPPTKGRGHHPPSSTPRRAASSPARGPASQRHSYASAHARFPPLPPPPPLAPPQPINRLASYIVDLGALGQVRLRGMTDDLAAITRGTWLRRKTHAEGYLEAFAKLLVYLVAAFSGNLTQAGAIVLMALLGASAGLLALSNAHVKSFTMRGRVAAVLGTAGGGGGRDKAGADDAGDGGVAAGGQEAGAYVADALGKETAVQVTRRGGGGGAWADGVGTGSWTADSESGGVSGSDDWVERGQLGGLVRDSYPFDDADHYS